MHPSCQVLGVVPELKTLGLLMCNSGVHGTCTYFEIALMESIDESIWPKPAVIPISFGNNAVLKEGCSYLWASIGEVVKNDQNLAHDPYKGAILLKSIKCSKTK